MASAFKNTTINDTGQLTLPVGTTAQRPKYKIETFTSDTTWTAPTDVSEIEVLIVGGGGGGGGNYGGGGGAGGLVYRSALTVTPGSSYAVTIASGGAGGGSGVNGANGTNSVFGNLINNGKFTANTTGWSDTGAATLSIVNGALRITNVAGASNGRAQYLPGFTTVIGRSYTVSATGVSRTAANYYLEVRSGVETSDSWTSGSIQRTFTAVQTTTYIELYAIGGEGVYAEYDDVSVSESGLTAIGGGGGGFHGSFGTTEADGRPGGSGGGGSIGGSGGTPATGPGGAGIEGQGFSGGTGYHVGPQYPAGGGGGAGGRGGDGTTSSPNKCGVGGPGLPFYITNAIAYYAGGGGGGTGGSSSAGPGGIGGGADGVAGSNVPSAATANLGGGGGGGGSIGGGAGGSGVVIIRYIAEKEFTANTTWTVPAGVNEVEVLVVGGGGGGGWAGGGGGGGGGVLYRPNFAVSPGSTFTVTVGAGGAGTTSNSVPGTNGGDSHFRDVSNLITNGSFISDVSGWTVADANEGSFVWSSGRAVLTNTSLNDPPVNAYQAVSLVVGRRYTVSATKIAGQDFVVNLMASPSSGGGTGGVGNVLYWPGTTYGRKSGTFVATDSTMYVVLRINNNANNVTVTLDDVELYETDKAIVAIGGGGGGTHNASDTAHQQGASGGSGGGASMNYNENTFAAGGGITGQGFAGGSSLETTDNPRITSGGGGAGGPAANTRSAVVLASMPNGGPGMPSSITGRLKYYGGGGGGGDTLLDRLGPGPGVGGIGGGGNGSRYSATSPVNATAGTANTGGGGGGGSNENSGTVKNGAAGGSGVVVIRYNPDTTAGTFDNAFTPNKIRFNTTSNKFDAPRLNSSPRSDVEYPVTDGLSFLLDAGSQKSYPKLNIIQVKCWTVTTAVRSAGYTVEYSDDGSTWTTAFGGVMSATGTPGMITGTVTSGGSGTTGTGAWGRRRHWRYVEGATVSGHHPRVSRIMLTDNEGTEHELVHYCQDNISDVGSYIIGTISTSVLGKTWYDLSGNNRHFHLNRMVSTNSEANTTSPAQYFTDAGPQSYFTVNSNEIIANALSTNRQVPFLGPPSDQMGFTQEHTIQAVVYLPAASINFLYHFAVNPRDISPLNAAGPNGADGSQRFASHLLYGGNSFYYDYPGCCDAQNRVDFGNGAGSGTAGGGVTGAVAMNASWTAGLRLATYRCRRTDFPRKQFFRDQTVEYSSLQKEVGYAINNRSDPGHLGTTNSGGQRFYYFAMYNRALTDAELGANWAYLSNRFAIS